MLSRVFYCISAPHCGSAQVGGEQEVAEEGGDGEDEALGEAEGVGNCQETNQLTQGDAVEVGRQDTSQNNVIPEVDH